LSGAKQVSRRKCLKYIGVSALGLSASALGLWQISKDHSSSPNIASRTQAYSTTTEVLRETSTSIRSEGTLGGKSLVSIVRGNSDLQIEAMVRKSTDALGGIGNFVRPGQSVVVKPPVLAPDKACAPDPRVIVAVVQLVKEAGGTAVVAESSGTGSTAYNLSKVGITSAVEELGVEVRDMSPEKPIQIAVPKGVALKDVNVLPTIRDCDVLISVPRLKRHGGATVTISLKNMMGTLPRPEMGRFHRTGLSQCIADLNTVVRPHLTVVDAGYAMTRTGPTGGDMVKLDMVFASGDPVAADTIAARELQKLEERIGLPSQSRFDIVDVRHIQAAASLGVGASSLDEIEIMEEQLS
jgi:uncharacterized protein (DUF362 family)